MGFYGGKQRDFVDETMEGMGFDGENGVLCRKKHAAHGILWRKNGISCQKTGFMEKRTWRRWDFMEKMEFYGEKSMEQMGFYGGKMEGMGFGGKDRIL